MASIKKWNHEAAEKAVGSLLKWRRKQTNSEPGDILSQDDDYFYLIVTLKKIPPPDRRIAYRIDLPNPLHSTFDTEICLIVGDRSTTKPPKSKLKQNQKEKQKEKNLIADEIGVSKVMKVSKLRENYKAFEEKRKLCESYDVFLAEKRIVGRLPALLGKQFYKNKRKMPIGVDLGGKSLKEEIEKAVGSGYMQLSSGTCSVVRVGRCGMEKEEVVENVVAAVEGVVKVLLKGWKSVRSFHLKLNGSLALPVYQALPDLKMRIKGVEGKKGVEESKDVVLGKKKGVEESNDMVLGKKKGLSKGRISEIKYMDRNAEEISDDEGVGSDEDASSGDNEMEADSFGRKKLKDGEVGVGFRKREMDYWPDSLT